MHTNSFHCYTDNGKKHGASRLGAYPHDMVYLLLLLVHVSAGVLPLGFTTRTHEVTVLPAKATTNCFSSACFPSALAIYLLLLLVHASAAVLTLFFSTLTSSLSY